MTTPKAMACRCEDVTVDDCRQAIRAGYACFEDLKRYLGVATGPCQGKACVQACMHLVAEERGIPVGDVDVMTFRPPVRPVPFATLAAPDAHADPPMAPIPPMASAQPDAPLPSAPSADRGGNAP